ncbi:hypothetical protein ACFTZ8_18455 [Streptomyces fungicidicus]|uniref:hypothetical protein n=1 Tax=Streptomyces fungicidicus TaxID=68203 RepID=UPI00363ABAC2
MSKKPGMNSVGTEYRERRIVITIRRERGRRSFQLLVDDHLTFGISISSAFLLTLLSLLIAAGYHWMAR